MLVDVPEVAGQRKVVADLSDLVRIEIVQPGNHVATSPWQSGIDGSRYTVGTVVGRGHVQVVSHREVTVGATEEAHVRRDAGRQFLLNARRKLPLIWANVEPA